MKKSLDARLSGIRSGGDAFIIAYAADPDMGAGVTGASSSMQAYCEDLTAIVEQAKIDILLTSVSNMDILARQKHLFDHSPVTPAIRANDTTDIWEAEGACYRSHPSRPFATSTIEEARYGTLTPESDQVPDVDLGLYSVTFNNDIDADWNTLDQFKKFRIEAIEKNFRYFLEVFNPNIEDCGIDPDGIPDYVNDQIARMLAGIPRASRPQFLKVQYNSAASMEALVQYDTSVVVGILGGPKSTTYDAFKLIEESKKRGARVALFGRRIKGTEDPLAFVEVLREVADGTVRPEEGVKVYREALERSGIKPERNLEEDMQIFTKGLLK